MAEDVRDLEFRLPLKDLGRRIRQVRLDRGLSVREMVIKHNYHDAQWRRYEAGASLTVPSLLRIAKVLETSLALLLEGVGDYSASEATPKSTKRKQKHEEL